MRRTTTAATRFLGIGLAALCLASAALAQKENNGSRELLLGTQSPSAEMAAKAVRGLGKVASKDRNSGMYRIVLREGLSPEAAKKELKRREGVRFVLDGTASQLSTRSLPSVTNYIEYLKARHSLLTGKNVVHAEDAEVDYLEAYRFYLEDRVEGDGKIDVDKYHAAVQHRESMPVPYNTQGITGNWTFIGPRNLDVPYNIYYGTRPINGRINAIAYHPTTPTTIYIGGGNGGVWKSTDSGLNWTPLSDSWTYLHVSDIKIVPSQPNTMYVATGDAHGGLPYSFGIMKTTDGGATWTNLGRTEFGWAPAAKIVVDPQNPSIVTVACYGSGMWRSTNGGTSWTRVQGGYDNFTDLEIGIDNGAGVRRMYAVSTGNQSADTMRVHMSTDRGATWTVIGSGGNEYAAEIAASTVSATTVYVLSPANKVIYKTSDDGTNWTNITGNFPAGDQDYNWSQYWYDYHINCAKNGTQDAIYVGLITLAMSPNGGGTWIDIGQAFNNTGAAKTHSDQHSWAVHPTNPNEVMIGNDGGLYKVAFNPTTNATTFTPMSRALGITMFYKMAIHPTDPNKLLGGTQDNASPYSNGDLNNWVNPGQGDGGFCEINQTTPNTQYVSWQNLGVQMTTNNWTSITRITPNTGSDRKAFIAPIKLANNGDLLAGTQFLYRYAGGAWTKGTTQLASGTGYIRFIATAPNDNNRIYTGASGGEMWMTTNGGTSWSQVNSGGLPAQHILYISVHPTNANDVIVALASGASAKLWRCANISASPRTWTNVSGTGATGLPNVPTNAIARDPGDPLNTWYVGNDVGAFMTTNAGSTWTNITNPRGLPNVQVNDLKVNATTGHLYAATNGRGMWRIQVTSGTPTTFSIAGSVTDNGSALTGATVTAYQSGNVDSTPVTSSPNASIPDNNTTGIDLPLNVSLVKTISSVKVGVNVTHTYRGDVELSIVHPDGTVVKLKNAPESDSAANIVTSYPDQSAPVQSLSALNGKASNGTWKLRVKDLAAADTGTVNSFSITIGYAGETAVKSVQSTSTGYTITGLADGSYVVRAAMTGKTFTPASYPVTLGPSVSGKNFSTTGGGTTAALSNLTFNPPSVVGGNPSTGTVTLTSAAPTGGASVSLTSSSTAITVPASVTVPAGATTATFTANTIRVTADVTRSVSATYLGVTKSANLTVIASAGVSNLTASPSTAYGGDKLVGTVTLTAAAPAGGANVTLRSGSSILLVPGSVMVSAGSTSAAFTIDTLHVYATYTRYIYADYAGTTKAVAITLSSGPALYSFTANPATVKGGSSTTGAIRLNAVAPAGGIKVYLQSGSSALIVPEFVTIPAGQSVVLFTIRTTAVSATVDRAIYARRGGISKTLVVRLNP